MAWKEYAKQQEERISRTPEGAKRLEETKKQIANIKSAPKRAVKAVIRKIGTSTGYMLNKVKNVFK